jgi:hypothetical protein
MNRRDFLKGAGAAAIVPAAIPGVIWNPSSPSANAAPTKSPTPVVPPISAVVYDERYDDCKLFAGALVRQGAVAFPARSDSAQLWYGPLREHLAHRPGRVAGFTTYADFSVSQSCGRELSLITLYEAAHDSRASRALLAHRVRTTGDETEIAAAFANSALPWIESLANALCRVPTTRDPAIRIASTVTTPRPRNHPGYLNSWLLAPRSETCT